MIYRVTFLCLTAVMMFGCSSEREVSFHASMGVANFGDIFPNGDNSAPKAPWQWVRENPSGWRIPEDNEGALDILIETGGLMGGEASAKNILVGSFPPTFSSMLVMMSANFETQYEQAGIILYRGGDDYVKLVAEMVDGVPTAVLVVEVDAAPAIVGKVSLPDVADDGSISVSLLLERRSNSVSGSLIDMTDSTKIPVGEADFPRAQSAMFGVFTQSGREGSDRWARFHQYMFSQ